MWDLVEYYHAGQMRKKTGEPYIHHLVRVNALAKHYYIRCESDEDYCINMLDSIKLISAGHDLLEDTDCTFEEISEEYGRFVADGIFGLTNVYGKIDYPDLNRKERKKLEVKRLAKLPWHLRLIKACDRMDNMSMRFHEPTHWTKNYKPETEALFNAIFPIKKKRFKEFEKVARDMLG